MTIGYSRFAVLDVPYCVWDLEPKRRNLEFIERIDPRYYDYIADINGEALQGETSQYAATSLRIAYCHGLETLFSLLCACIQAPDCVIGWLQKYRPDQLRKLVEAIFNRRTKIHCKLDIQRVTFEELSGLINRFSLKNEEKIERLKGSFSTLWYRFAGDFLNEELIAEYNSLKHGFRINPGGFKLMVGHESTPGVAAPADRMTSLGGSDFGSSFSVTEGIGIEADKKNTTHFRLKATSLNWDPECMAAGLRLISISLNNILAFLKLLNGSSSDVRLRYPCDESNFEIPWSSAQDGMSIGFNPIIREEDIVRFSDEEILNVYKQK